MNESADFTLPPSIVSKLDITRLLSELERVDNEQTTADVRQKVGSTERAEITLSKQLSELLEQNKLSIDEGRKRSELIKKLRSLKENMPVVHMTFAVPADHESLQRLVTWWRESVHPQVVIEVGLQPALVAGVSIRTPNRVHDLSMRTALKNHHDQLVKELETLRGNN